MPHAPWISEGQTISTKEVHRTRTIDGNTRTRIKAYDFLGIDRTRALHEAFPELGSWDRFREAITVTNGSNNPGSQYVSELSRALYGSSTALRHNRITPVPAATTRVQTASQGRKR
jgi:hypothetical protein